MPDKRVVYLLFAAALGVVSCRRAPESDFRILRLVDLLEAKNVAASPFASGALDPADPVNFHEKNRPLLDRGVLKDPYGLKRKLFLRGSDMNTLVAPPGSIYAFDFDLPKNALLEFGVGVVRGENSETVRKRLSATEGGIRFRVQFEMSGRTKTLFLESVEQPPLVEGQGLKLIPERVALPPAGGKARITFLTEGPEGAFAFWANPLVIRTGARARRVILISIDTLRADHLGCYGYRKNTTPHADALAADGALFTDVYAPCSWTLPSHVSLLTSLSCFRHGVNLETDRMEETRPTLADVLRSEGFLCAGIHGGGFLSPLFGFSKGFDVYKRAETSLWTSDAAGQVSAAAADWIEANKDRDFFLFVHTYQLHDPYIPPAPYDTKFQDAPTSLKMINVGGHLGGPGGHLQAAPRGRAPGDHRPLRRGGRIHGCGPGRRPDGEAQGPGHLRRHADRPDLRPRRGILRARQLAARPLALRRKPEGPADRQVPGLEVPREDGSGASSASSTSCRRSWRLSMIKAGRTRPRRPRSPRRPARPGKEGPGGPGLSRGRGPEQLRSREDVPHGRPDEGHPQPAVRRGRGRILPVPAAGRPVEVEAYDLAADPGERTDIAARKAPVAARLVALMRELEGKGRKPAGQKTVIDVETEEKLRALGYIR